MLRREADVSELLQDIVAYGSYQTLGNLSVTIDTLEDYENYTRTLDLETGVHTSAWTTAGVGFETSVFCSYPAQSCVYSVSSTAELPTVRFALGNQLIDAGLAHTACEQGASELQGVAQAPAGLHFDAVARVLGNASTSCSADGRLVHVPPAAGQTSLAILFSAESNYDQTKGTAADDYAFTGAEPAPLVAARLSRASSQPYAALLRAHTQDYAALMGRFTLTLPDTAGSATRDTAALVARYAVGTPDPFLESLLFDYSRHLLMSSSRPGALPANLQGRWAEGMGAAWSGDYHANINLQMSYWGAEQTGLGVSAEPLFAYMANTWVPRGTETAQLLYGAPGWVVHNEMNIFGYTGMKSEATWANCESLSPDAPSRGIPSSDVRTGPLQIPRRRPG